MSTAVESITIPSVDEHALVQRHARQREELEKKLTGAQSRRAELLGERQQLRRARHTHDVAVLLGDRASEQQPDDATRLAQIDVEIDRAAAAEAAASDALEVHNVIAAGTRAHVEAEICQQVEASARAVLRQMVPRITEVLALNQQLAYLAGLAPGLLVPPPALLIMWAQQARGVLGDR